MSKKQQEMNSALLHLISYIIRLMYKYWESTGKMIIQITCSGFTSEEKIGTSVCESVKNHFNCLVLYSPICMKRG